MYRVNRNRVLLVLVLAGCAVACRDGKDIPVTPEEWANVYGTVTDTRGNPVPGVVISDSHKCVVTDANGIYQLKAESGTRQVSISVPSGYAIPIGSNGLPKMYNNLVLQSGKAVRSDFVLTPEETPTRAFTLMALADVQVSNATHVSELSEQVMPGILSHCKSLQGPVYAISLGDMGWDNMEILRNDYVKQITRLPVPVFHVIGNHDYDASQSDDYAAAAVYRNVFGPESCSWNIGDCHFVSLDDIIYEGHKEYSRGLTDQVAEWLRQDLSYVPSDKLVIIGMHAPSDRRYSPSSTYFTGRDRFYEILRGRKVLILSAHLHHNFQLSIAPDIREFEHGAVCGQLWDGTRLCNDGSPRGFAVYRIEGNTLKDQYYMGAETGRDDQIRLYAPGTYATVQADLSGSVVANIFNWHSDWTVRFEEDGTQTVADPATNLVTYDYSAYAAQGSKTASPYCDHLFAYTPRSAGWSKISVSATDPFGNTYSASLSR